MVYCFILFWFINIFVLIGFKSRVKFYNVKDLMRMSYYIFEVVDVGFLGLFFMVKKFFIMLLLVCVKKYIKLCYVVVYIVFRLFWRKFIKMRVFLLV